MASDAQSPLNCPILILSTGRAGSTLLQKTLNLAPGVCIWGEHEGILTPIADSYYRLLESEKLNFIRDQKKSKDLFKEALIRLKDKTAWPGWANSQSRESIKKTYRHFILDLFCSGNSDHRWGFKEVRYCWENDRSIEMMIDLFPHIKILILVRDPIENIKSMIHNWYSHENSDDIQESIARQYKSQAENFLILYKEYPKNIIILRYEDLIKRFDSLINSACDFLGIQHVAEMTLMNDQKVDYEKKLPQSRDISHDIREKFILSIVKEVSRKLGYDY